MGLHNRLWLSRVRTHLPRVLFTVIHGEVLLSQTNIYSLSVRDIGSVRAFSHWIQITSSVRNCVFSILPRMKISMGFRLNKNCWVFIHHIFPISVLVIAIFRILQGVPGPRGQKGERGPTGQQVGLYFVSKLWIYHVGSILPITKLGF